MGVEDGEEEEERLCNQFSVRTQKGDKAFPVPSLNVYAHTYMYITHRLDLQHTSGSSDSQ